MKIVRMREGDAEGGLAECVTCRELRPPMSSSSVLVRGIGAASAAGAGIRIGRVGEWKRGSRDRGAREGGVRGGSGELHSV